MFKETKPNFYRSKLFLGDSLKKPSQPFIDLNYFLVMFKETKSNFYRSKLFPGDV